MKVVVLVKARDVLKEQRSHLWRLKQKEIKNHDLIMTVIEPCHFRPQECWEGCGVQVI